MSYSEWGKLVVERFPIRDPVTIERDWEAVKDRLSVGQSVSGTVVAKAPFGAWIDISVGFPALLEIVAMDGLTPERYRSDEWCPIGSEVTAFVAGFRESGHQVALWQVRSARQDTQS